MVDPITVEATDTQRLADAQVADVSLNFAAAQRNFNAIMTAINELITQTGSGGQQLDLEAVNVALAGGAGFQGFLAGMPQVTNVQDALVRLDAKNRAGDLTVDKTNFDNTFAPFTGVTMQDLMDFCDGALQPLIVARPSLQNLSFGFGLVQPAGFNIFTSILNATRTFNIDITRPTDFSRFELKANGTEIATYTLLSASTRNQLIPNIVQQQPDWDTAVAAGGTDAAGRTIVNMVIEGILPNLPDIVSNQVQVLIGAPAQTEMIYYVLSDEADGAAQAIGDFTLRTVSTNPATFDFTLPATADAGSKYIHVLVPDNYDTVVFAQVTPLGDLPANGHFDNFATPGSRTIGSSDYNVYTSGPLVTDFTATYRITVQDTS